MLVWYQVNEKKQVTTPSFLDPFLFINFIITSAPRHLIFFFSLGNLVCTYIHSTLHMHICSKVCM